MPMDPRDIVLIVCAFLTILGSGLAARIAGRSAEKVKELDVDAQAYLNAQVITDGLINNLRTELGRAQTQIEGLHETLGRERNNNEQLKMQLDGLQQTMAKMNDRLREAGLAPLGTYHHQNGPGTGPIPLPPTS
jgi:hypothetical protein